MDADNGAVSEEPPLPPWLDPADARRIAAKLDEARPDLIDLWARDDWTVEPLDRAQRCRVAIESAAKFGLINPEIAEALAAKLGIGPMADPPEPDQHDPMAMPFWSLPMSMAWIGSRRLDDVRELMPDFHEGRLVWEAFPPGTYRVEGGPNSYELGTYFLLVESRPPPLFELELDSERNPKEELWIALQHGYISASAVLNQHQYLSKRIKLEREELSDFEIYYEDMRGTYYLASRINFPPQERYYDVKLDSAAIVKLWPPASEASDTAKTETAKSRPKRAATSVDLADLRAAFSDGFPTQAQARQWRDEHRSEVSRDSLLKLLTDAKQAGRGRPRNAK